MATFATIRTGRAVACALLVSVLLLTSGRPAAADATMSVSDVQVDVTAKSATDARDQAIADAQAKAFDRLVRRLVTNPADQARIKPGQAEIEGMVQDFAVQSERSSTVRYIGVYTVRFRAGRVRKYLADAGISSVGEVQEVMVVPVYQAASGPLLWGPSNAWRIAWDRGGTGDGPASLILPNGDPFDRGTLSVEAAVNGDPEALGAIMRRYHVAGVVVAVAQPRDPAAGAASGLTVTATIYDSTGSKGAQTVTVDPLPGEPGDKTLLRAVAAMSQTLETTWGQAGGATGLVAYSGPPNEASEPAGGGIPFPVTIPLNGIGDWVAARDKLTGIPGVQGVTLDVLTRQGAAVTVDFAGDPGALQAALAGSGYTLGQNGAGGSAGFAPQPGGSAVAPPVAVVPLPAGPLPETAPPPAAAPLPPESQPPESQPAQ